MEILEDRNMKTVCYYCTEHIRGDRQAKRVSHGICPKCSRKMKSGWKFTLIKRGQPVLWFKQFKRENTPCLEI